MKPLPKWVTILSLVAGIFGALCTANVLTVVSPAIGATIVGTSAVLAYLSTHLVGDGMPVGFGWISLIVAAVGALNVATYTNAAGAVVHVASFLPSSMASILGIVGTLGAALTDASHPSTGNTVGTGGGSSPSGAAA